MEYQRLVELYECLSKTTKRLAKTHLLSVFLSETTKEDIPRLVLLLQGKVFPDWDERETGVASRLVMKAMSTATGISAEQIEQEWKTIGDLGEVALKVCSGKRQSTLFSSELTIKKVFDNLRKLATLEGAGTVNNKMQLIAELLTSAKPLEAKYIVRTVLKDLRVGVGEGSLRDAIVWAFFGDKVGLKYLDENKIDISSREEYNKYADAVQNAFNLTNDFASVAASAKEGLNSLLEMDIVVFRPLKVMLALKVDGVTEGFSRCGNPLDAEYKLDGFRIQAHKKDGKVRLFTRRLEDVTVQFPEVVKYMLENVKAETFILDSEAAGYDTKTKKYLPFQKISQRIKRKYDIEELSIKFPVEVNVFDLIYYNGKNMINEEFIHRREIIEKIVSKKPGKIVPAKNLIASTEEEVEQFYQESLNAGNEGIMLKKLDAPYKPGARVGYMVKIKPVMETLDLVIIGGEWGTGKRATWLSSFILGCVDDDGNFLEIGRMGTGIKEKPEEGTSFEQLTSELKPLIISEKGREVRVKPKIVVEVNYEEIQKSPTYSSGYALRFPRLVNLRMDRDPSEASNISVVEDLYKGQRKR